MKQILIILTSILMISSSFTASACDKHKAVTPETILPDGADHTIANNPYTGEAQKVRKGTVAATIANIAKLNTLLKDSPKNHKKEIQNSVDVIDDLIPSLMAAGMFNLFEGIEWLNDELQPGKIITGILYFNHYPNRAKDNIMTRLVKLKQQDLYKNYIKLELTK